MNSQSYERRCKHTIASIIIRQLSHRSSSVASTCSDVCRHAPHIALSQDVVCSGPCSKYRIEKCQLSARALSCLSHYFPVTGWPESWDECTNTRDAAGFARHIFLFARIVDAHSFKLSFVSDTAFHTATSHRGLVVPLLFLHHPLFSRPRYNFSSRGRRTISQAMNSAVDGWKAGYEDIREKFLKKKALCCLQSSCGIIECVKEKSETKLWNSLDSKEDRPVAQLIRLSGWAVSMVEWSRRACWKFSWHLAPQG